MFYTQFTQKPIKYKQFRRGKNVFLTQTLQKEEFKPTQIENNLIVQSRQSGLSCTYEKLKLKPTHHNLKKEFAA